MPGRGDDADTVPLSPEPPPDPGVPASKPAGKGLDWGQPEWDSVSSSLIIIDAVAHFTLFDSAACGYL
jgi:hypothetical protein